VKRIQIISKNLISKVLKELSSDVVEFDKYYSPYPLLSICALTKTNFNRIDKEFKYFGKRMLKMIRISEDHFTQNEKELILDSFSELVLSNLGYSNYELFPELDITDITKKLQVYLLMNGRNFRLLPCVLQKCSDLKFQFK
jgi:hypothetical protein